MKALVSLLAVAILLTSSTTLIPVKVSAENNTSPRLYATDLSATDIVAPPIIVISQENGSYPFYTDNPVIYTATGNATIWVSVGTPYQVYVPEDLDTIMFAGGYLTSVSYRASWQNNQTINVYVYSGSSKTQVDFNLTDIPIGEQQLEVSASCNVLLYEGGVLGSSTYPVPQNGNDSIDLSVLPQLPTPTPSPTPTSTPTVSPTASVPEVAYCGVVLLLFVLLALSQFWLMLTLP